MLGETAETAVAAAVSAVLNSILCVAAAAQQADSEQRQTGGFGRGVENCLRRTRIWTPTVKRFRCSLLVQRRLRLSKAPRKRRVPCASPVPSSWLCWLRRAAAARGQCFFVLAAGARACGMCLARGPGLLPVCGLFPRRIDRVRGRVTFVTLRHQAGWITPAPYVIIRAAQTTIEHVFGCPAATTSNKQGVPTSSSKS